ncbi:MAG TPA: glycosyltransferase family 4 protein [Candidatus Omnitrophota bacterium]|nr:glycosyltransferase family 4 protein [Candidatus Omnitrophota bacterium]
MRKIKVAQVITRMDWGGSPDIVRILCERLSSDRYEVWLLTGGTEHPGKKTEDFFRRFKDRIIFVPELKRDVLPVSDLAAFFRLYFLFLKHRFDIAHTHTAKAGFLGRVAAKLAGVKMVIHTPHGNNFYGYFGRMFSALVVWLERFADCFTDRTIVLTELEKKDLIAYGVSKKEKIFVVPSGLELEEYSKGKADIAAKRQELGVSDANEAVVAMIGRLEPVKGPGYFIEAAGLVLKEFPAVRFLLAGDGSLKERLKRRSEELGIGDRIVFLGWREDVPEILSAVDILALPSLNEAVGRVILEAGCLGVPAVASRTGGVPEIIRDGSTGILVSPGSARELAEGILLLFRDKEKRRAMGQAAKEWVSGEFSAGNMVKQIEGLYGETVMPR